MTRVLILGLLAWQAWAGAAASRAWRDAHRAFWEWRWRFLAAPQAAHGDWCARQGPGENGACTLSVAWRAGDGHWQDVCGSGEVYRHRAPRYWRLTVACRWRGPFLGMRWEGADGVIMR